MGERGRESAASPPPAGGLSRLLARTSLRAHAPSVRATDHAPRGQTQREADKTPTCPAKPQLVTTYLLHRLFSPQSEGRPPFRERKTASRCSPLRVCHANAPVQARRAYARCTGPAPPNPPAVACNRLLARTSLRATAPSVRATDHAPRGHTQREADKAFTCPAKPQLVTTYLLHHLFRPQSRGRPPFRERQIESRCSPLRVCHANALAKPRRASADVSSLRARRPPAA